MSVSDGELNRLRAGEEEPAAEECPGEVSFRLSAPRVFLAGESAAVGESGAGCLLAAAARIDLLDGETGGKEGDFAFAAPRVFLAGESTEAVATTVGLLREGELLEAAVAPRVFLPGESTIIAAADGGAFEGDFLLAFFAGESNTSGGGGGLAAPTIFDGFVPAPALGGGLDLSSCNGLLGGVFRGGAGGG